MAEFFYESAADVRCETPVSKDELLELIRSGQLSDERRIWTQGLDDWTPLAECGDLLAVEPLQHHAPLPVGLRKGGPEPEPALSLSPRPGSVDPLLRRSPGPEESEEGEPPSSSLPAVALGTWSLVFEALRVESTVLPADHMLHSSRFRASVDGWQSMVDGVADVLRNAGVDRRRLTTQQYTTREGRNHLVQPVVLRTAKHAALNPGDWSAFNPVLEEWLGPLLPSVVELLLPAADTLLPPSASPAPSITPGSSRARQPPPSPRRLTAAETAQVAHAKLLAEVQALREEKAKREAADADEDGAVVLNGLRERLETIRAERASHPIAVRMKLGTDEAAWSEASTSAAAERREALLAAHEAGNTAQTEEQAILLEKMQIY
ncbi:MAG: DUF4339 domain-containing protein, partial [Actinomycetota bacterium]|nr:DUF4339 domain-containing protein [Actinomycetota bacterium]